MLYSISDREPTNPTPFGITFMVSICTTEKFLTNTRTRTNIICPSEVMAQLSKLDGKSVTEIYGQMFTAIWKKGHEKKLVTGRIIYARITPPWLRVPVVFLYGQNNNESTIFALRRLPTKSEIREAGNHNLSLSVLATFLRIEISVCPPLPS